MMMKASVALAPASSSHCHICHHRCHRIMIVTAQPHLWRNRTEQEKGRKSQFLWPKAAIVLRVARMRVIMERLGLVPLLDPSFKVVGS
jgi:hypothetical protein